MKNNSVIIIGAGLSGLECGYILAKNGFEVTLLEHGKHIGGCLQSFNRKESCFDTGFHYVGGLGEGESLNRLFQYFHLMDLPWHRLDTDCFDQVYLGDKAYPFANGHQNFVERLTEYFPDQKEGLEKYVRLLKNTGDHIFDAFEKRDSTEFYSGSLFGVSAYDFLQETISDPTLRQVLSGTSLKMELKQDSLPLYIFAQINNSFIQSAWRLEGGGGQIARSLADDIEAMGGKILTKATVTEMIEKDGKISEVIVNGEEHYTADWIISSAHPAVTLDLIHESSVLKKIYRKRISRMENTFGAFTANISLKKDKMEYLNRNLFFHKDGTDLWNAQPDSMESILVSYGVPHKGKYAETIDLITPMSWNSIAQWANIPDGRKQQDYLDFKESTADRCIRYVNRYLPELEGAIDKIYTSTPLTYNRYTLTPEGSAYGLRKDFQNTLGTVMSPHTPISNLLYTGQNLNLHGVLGVSMTSVITCAMILGLDEIRNQILK